MNRLRRTGLVLFLTLIGYIYCTAQSGNPIVYVYDDLGRLVAVTDPNSDTVVYQYDAVGNLLSISRYSSTQLSIIQFDPTSGLVGANVTISGTGFSSTPNQNTVQFNGTTAPVNSATSTQLNVTVPSGATTGPITVTTPSGSVSSGTNFIVLAGSGAPTITSFTPNMGISGTAVTITGTNFDIAANDRVSFNTTFSATNSATISQITTSVPSSAGSGRISVATPAGTATSTQDFYIPFGTHAVADIAYTNRIAFGTTQTVSLAANKIALLLFDGTAGQGVSLQFSGSTFSTCTVYLYSPTQVQLASTGCTSSTTFLSSTTLSANGTYTIGIDPGTSTGSITVGLTSDVTGTITPGTPLNTSITSHGQGARYTFRGTAGQIVSTEIAGFGGNNFSVYLLKPNGSTLASAGGTNQVAVIGKPLPDTGSYTIWIAPSNGVTGSATVSLTNQTVNGTITFNTPVTSTISTSSLIGLNFSGTSGQIVSAEATGLGGGYFTMYILNPDGSISASSGWTSQVSILGKTLATTGTYQIVLVPNNGVTGSVAVSLVSQSTNNSISFNTPVTKTISTSSLIGLNFSGTSGQIVSAEATGLGGGFFTMYILNPDGSTSASSGWTNQVSIVGKTLATTGAYQIVIVPNSGVTGSVTVSLVSQTTNNSITFNTPVTSTISTSSLIGLNFSGTSGQIVTAEATGLGGGFFTLYILNPDGSTSASSGWTNQVSVIGKTLATTGTYQIVIVPNSGVTGSVTVSLVSQTTNNSITFNTPVTSTISTSSLIGLNFSGTSGQVVSVEGAGLNGSFSLYLLNPDGTTLGSSSGSGAVNITGKTLASTGTYEILIIPNNGVTGSITISLISQTTNNSISFNTPVNNTISSSSLIGLNFSGTAGQVVSTESAGLNGNYSLVVLKPDGSQLGSSSGSGALNLTGKTLATTGTYQIVIIPNSGVTGSITISLVSQTTNNSISFNTPVTSTISSSSLIAFSFSGTAGQVMSTESAGLNGFYWLVVLKPDGSQLGSSFNSGALNLTGKTLATTGTYQILIIPNNGVTGSITISLISQTTNNSISFNTPVTSTISSSSLIGLNFSGTAGQVVSAESAGLNGNYWLVLLKPDGSQLGSSFGGPTLSLTGKTLATTGTYQVLLIPNNGVTGSATISLVSQTTNDTINFGTPVTKTVSVTSLIGLSFSGTANQTVSVQITPSFSGGLFSAYILNPDGSTLTSTSSLSTVTFSGKVLGSTGTYEILIVPNNGVTGSATTSLTSP